LKEQNAAFLFRAYFSSAFYVPADMDAYFFFAPNSSTDGSKSPTGKFRFKAIY